MMTNSAKSVFYFGLYMAGLGTVLVLWPNFLLNIFGISSTSEVWIRVVGMLVLALCTYYIVAGRHNNILFFKVTTYVRPFISLFFIAFATAGLVEPTIILFGVVDLLGAVWTYLALKKEGNIK